MADHSGASPESKNLCERLFRALNQRIPNLEYRKGANKCSIGVIGGRKIFAWINSHSSRKSRLNIWFLGNLDQASRFRGLSVQARKTAASGSWADYEGSFSVDNDEQLADAVELLVSVSYPESIQPA